jgi:hypothetical protein
MKKRFLYSLLFGIPGFFSALIAAFVAFGASAGVLWIFVFGDNPWPPAVDAILPVLLLVVLVGVWVAITMYGYVYGKGMEDVAHLNKIHVLISVAATVAPIAVIVLHQFGVGNLGPPSDGVRCSKYCSQLGYSASGMPPKDSGDRSCICFDGEGREAVTKPVDRLGAIERD